MDKLEILQYITEHNKDFRGKLVTENGFKKMFPEMYDVFKNTVFPSFFDDFDFKQKLWHFLRDDFTQHICKCGCELKFRSFWFGYNNFCKLNCPSMIDNQVKKVKQKNLSKTKDEKDKIQEKVKQTFLAKYGVERYSQTKEWKEKTISKNKEKFGKEWFTQTDEYKQIYENICEKKYGSGIKNAFQDDGVKEIIKQKFYDSFLKRHNNVLKITNETLICKCTDPNCTLCDERIYEIKKKTFSDRICHNIDTCTNRTKYGEISSISERVLYDYIKSIYSGEIITNDRSVLFGKELDIYLPELKLAFEFNGIYWHNEFNKDKEYHQVKSLGCLKSGVQLIHIWEDDWKYRSDIIKDIIKTKLCLSENKLGARKCRVSFVENKVAYDFLNEYHIQGGLRNGKSIGLFYKDELVEILTFGELRKNMGGKPIKGHYEIYRVCSKSGYNIQGGFSKLLRFFENQFDPECIITYGNLDYTIGNVYLKCGFKFDKLSKPTYSWVVDGRRRHRSNYMKSKLKECKDNPNLTEIEVMYNRGCWRCWDSGKIRFVKERR